MKKGKLIQKRAQVHIRINNPIMARRLILGSALDTGHLLKEFSEIQHVREKKVKVFRNLQRVLREIKSLEKQFSIQDLPEFTDNEIEHLMPHQEAHHNTAKPEHGEHNKAEVKKTVQKAPHPKTEAEKLKDELQAIENKLKSLQ